MSAIDLRDIDIRFKWSKSTPGVINYRAFVTGYVPDDTKDSGEERIFAEVTGTLTPTQFSSLSAATVKSQASTALEALGAGSHVVTDDTDT